MSETYIKINNKNKKRRLRYTSAPISGHPKKGGFYIVSRAFLKEGATNPRPKLHVKRGDTVMVVSGSEKGKTGKVIAALPREGKVIVENINMIKKHQKSKGMGRAGEIIEKEAPIFASKVMLYDSVKKKPTRFGYKILKEFRVKVEEVDSYKIGEAIDSSKVLVPNEYVDVTGMSIGKGFQGMVKLYNKQRGPKSHGSKSYRGPGSIGAHTYPGRVLPGKKMPSRMGNEKVTARNLKVVEFDKENNLLLVRGSVPGVEGKFITIRPSIKSWN